MKILLTGATLWKESDGFKVYTKPGNEFDAQADWFLLEPKDVIYYVSLIFRRYCYFFFIFFIYLFYFICLYLFIYIYFLKMLMTTFVYNEIKYNC